MGLRGVTPSRMRVQDMPYVSSRSSRAAAVILASYVLLLVSCSKQVHTPVHIPRGEVIAFASYQLGGGYDPQTPPGGIYVMRADGSGAVHVHDLLGCPSWSPDASGIVFGQPGDGPPNEVWVVNSDGTGLRRLGAGSHPAWSPDGTKIAFAYYSQNLSVHLPRPEGIYVMSPEGAEVRLLVSSLANNAGLGEPGWSPDGTRLAFPAQVSDGAASWALFVARADGAGFREIPHTRGVMVGSPAWSPDGTRIVFARARKLPLPVYGGGVIDGDFPGDPYVVHVEGAGFSHPTPFGSIDTWANPSWSPDGTKIAFDRNDRTWVVQADGTGVTRLAGAEEGPYSDKVDFCPAWSPAPILDS